MVKIRLQRHGRKKRAFYYIVAADQRAPRDGRYIERIGSYNPNTNPATIDLDLDASVRWLQNGAVPSDTCRAILSYKGALYKNHLLKGVTKNAFTEEEANQKFENWLEQKAGRIDAKKDHLAKTAAELQAEAFKQEEAKRLAREKAIAEKNAPPAEIATEEEPVAETELSEETSEAAPVAERNEAVAEPETAEEPAAEVTEEPVAEVTEEPVAEVTEETVAEVTEEPTAEVSEEPASEQKDETADASEEKPEESAEESTEEK